MIFRSRLARIQGCDSNFLGDAGPERARVGRSFSRAAFFLSLLFVLPLVGCVTKAKINDVNLSFTTVKRVVLNSLPQGLKEESLNGRELTSGFFSPRNWEEDATEKAERAYAKVVILGSVRPYRINASVFREKRQKNGSYSNLGEDKKLTKDLVDRLDEALADRREERNIIDDFRAF